jgi:hypothetical protein
MLFPLSWLLCRLLTFDTQRPAAATIKARDTYYRQPQRPLDLIKARDTYTTDSRSDHLI